MWSSTESERTSIFLTENDSTKWIFEVLQVTETSQLKLDLVKLIAVLQALLSVDEGEHWRREHLFGEFLVVINVGELFHLCLAIIIII